MSKIGIPPYYRQQCVAIISYTYTKNISTKIFHYKHVVQNLKIDPDVWASWLHLFKLSIHI